MPVTVILTPGRSQHRSSFGMLAEGLRSGQLRPGGRRTSTCTPIRTSMLMLFLHLVLVLLLPTADAAFINFENCLDPNIVHSNPLQLQFIPLHLNARYNTTDPRHNLNITVYGNVSGQATEGVLPAWDNKPYWDNPNNTFGKIVDISPTNNYYSTLFSRYQVLSYTPYNAPGSQFCASVVNATCPIAPAFNKTASDPYSLPAFTVAHDFYSSYAFATLATTIRIQSGDRGAPALACVSANITPDLGPTLSGALTFVPVAVLVLVAIATISAARFSPWSPSDLFYWTSNYGRDEDLLRLVTPGFGDCLQYIQFIVLAGSLSLNYPGYYQPVVSQASWATLMFNESFVSHGNGSHSLVDGIYFTNSTYGLTRLSQLVGMTESEDIWAGMAIWLCVIIVGVVLLCQLGFAFRWVWRQISNTQEQDLRSKNWPFTAGIVVRILYNYFLLPIISLSMFQLVVASRSPASVVAMAVVLLTLIVCFAAWIFRLIFTTKPRAHLFDDLPTVLLYGPLYNTYSDVAAPFAFIPVLLTFIRGVAIGAVQPSGIAQLILLAICEVIMILTLHAFRPFQAPTSMNAYHTFFAIIRLITTLLSIAFVPSLGVNESSKGWIGYAILLLHAIVLVFGFFLNSVQTLIEVSALALSGGDARGGLTKVFGMRQLRRRNPNRGSLTSDAAILTQDGDNKSIQLMGGRSRSLSASSGVLLNQTTRPSARTSVHGFDQFSQGGEDSYGNPSPGPVTPGGAQSPFSYLPSATTSGGPSRRPTLNMQRTVDPIDPYYRPPRQRRGTTGEPYTPGARSRGSVPSGEWVNKPYEDPPTQAEPGDSGEGPSAFSPGNRNSVISPVYLRSHREDSDPDIAGRRNNTDYAVRESDFYYGVRGPALSSLPTRRLGTGPADPMGPVSSATGWFKNFLGGKRKEKGKGFEVVRSTRAPVPMMPLDEDASSPRLPQTPYLDSPDAPRGGVDWPLDDSTPLDRSRTKETSTTATTSDDRTSSSSPADSLTDTPDPFSHRVSAVPPMLGPIDAGAGLDLPSRIGSQASSVKPYVPRKSSRRPPSMDNLDQLAAMPRLSSVAERYSGASVAAPVVYPWQQSSQQQQQQQYGQQHGQQHGQQREQHLRVHTPRLPFDSEPSPSPERGNASGTSAASSIYPAEGPLPDLPDLPGGRIRVPQREERPMSTGEVAHHLAAESIQQGVYARGSSAEVVEEEERGRGRWGFGER